MLPTVQNRQTSHLSCSTLYHFPGRNIYSSGLAERRHCRAARAAPTNGLWLYPRRRLKPTLPTQTPHGKAPRGCPRSLWPREGSAVLELRQEGRVPFSPQAEQGLAALLPGHLPAGARTCCSGTALRHARCLVHPGGPLTSPCGHKRKRSENRTGGLP